MDKIRWTLVLKMSALVCNGVEYHKTVLTLLTCGSQNIFGAVRKYFQLPTLLLHGAVYNCTSQFVLIFIKHDSAVLVY